MSILQIQNLRHSYGGFDIIRNVNLNVEKHHRTGLIGLNGSGKTTLLKILHGSLEPSEGMINSSSGLKISFLTQDPQFDNSKTLLQYVTESRSDILKLDKEIEKLHDEMEHDHSEELLKKYENLTHEFETLGGFSFSTERKLVLTHLRFDTDLWHKKLSDFSGGEKTRIQLARILLEPFDLLLLDEPTNHLDYSMILWLERYLYNMGKPYILISHDRHFLDRTVDQIWEIDRKTIYAFKGNYSGYLQESERQKALQKKMFDQQKKVIEKTEDFIRRNMAGQKVNQAKSRQKMLDKMDIIEKPAESKRIKIRFDTESRSGNDVFRIEKLDLKLYGRKLIENLNLNVHYQDKIVLIGRNGCGKTSFLKLLMGEIRQTCGTLYKGANLKVGYYDQMHIHVPDGITVMDYIWSIMPDAVKGQVIGYLAGFGFTGEDLDKKTDVLSGGEKARLYLLRILYDKPNLLILDEPTNHLDVFMVDALEKALREYDGTLIFVSHDMYFINNVAERKLLFRNSSISETDKSIEQIADEQTESKKKKKSTDRKPDQGKSRKVNPQVIEKLLEEISELEDEKDSMHIKIAEKEACYSRPEYYQNHEKMDKLKTEIAEDKKKSEELSSKIEDLEMKYLMLTDEDQEIS